MDIDQLKKFVLLLGSSQDGEVLAALRKLRAALKQADTDLHFIADGLGSAEEVDRARRAAAAARAELADFRRKSDQFLKATLERLEVAEKAVRSRKETETKLRAKSKRCGNVSKRPRQISTLRLRRRQKPLTEHSKGGSSVSRCPWL